MLFNSLDFAIFLPVVFALYWLLRKQLRVQNAFIVAASYLFYGWWDWRFLSLLLFSSMVDFLAGRGMMHEQRAGRRKLFLAFSLLANLGLLGFFKYYNFFIDNFTEAFRFLGMSFHPRSLQIILPVGISFYTFQSLSYAIDVYRRKVEPTKDVVAFLAYVSFFPQLVAGPIERASHLLPQFFRTRVFEMDKASDGMRQILWGLFKKMVIADKCGEIADLIFNDPGSQSGSTLMLGTVMFGFQIYGDFSGYSDIAIGTARLFGFDLRRNFAFPYFSRDIAEFWRRWHISLTTWFRDYVYIPLGGSREGKARALRNTFIVFLVSGFWHGAHWKYLAWGGMHAFFFLPLLLGNRNRRHLGDIAPGRILPGLKEGGSILLTFLLVTLAWVLFRAGSLEQAGLIYERIFSASLFTFPGALPAKLLLFLALFLVVEWTGRNQAYAIEKIAINRPRYFRWAFYYILAGLVLLEGGADQPFIYFQF